MKKVILSENSVTYIDPSVFNFAPNLQYLDLSSNLLGNAISVGFILSIMNKVLKLEALILSNNLITTVPLDSFSGNNSLRVLDLSYNRLEAVTFVTHRLTSLTKLDLSHNNIVALDHISIDRLSCLLHYNETQNTTKQTDLKIHGNPFICSCDDIHFLIWLVDINESLKCKLDSEERMIDRHLIAHVEFLCKRNIVIAVFCTYAIIVVILILAMVYVLILEFRRIAHRKQIREAVRNYKTRREKKSFPVFLSFCSEDDEVVMKDIYPNLEKGLKNILGTDSQCVATGYDAFRPGYSLADEIIRCVEASSVVVFFITNRFCRKSWCRNETLVAHYENKPMVLMLWENIDLKLMPRCLHSHYLNHARVHWIPDENGVRRIRPGWEEVCEVIASRFVQNQDE